MKQARNPLVIGIAAVLSSLAATPVMAQDSGARMLEEVVVTATRRAESMQEVPVAVTAATEEDMAFAQVDSVGNIQAISPSIKFDVTNSAANSANIFIRGIGTVGNNRSFEGAVGVFFDGVYRTRAGQAMQNWLDIESLQVLRGPQGTLFGKNTSAGALIINSKAPTPEAVEGSYEVTVGNYGKEMIRAAYNQPVGESSAIRVAGLYGNKEGFIKNSDGGDFNDSHPRAAKFQFLTDATDNLTLRMIIDWSSEDANCCYGQVDDVDGPMQSYIDDLTVAAGHNVPSKNFDDYEQALSNDTDQSVSDQGIQFNVDWALDNGMAVTSVTSYREWSIEQYGMDADFSGANILGINESLETEVFSQEFTLSGDFTDFGPFQYADYVMGIYFADEKINADHQLVWGNQATEYLLAYALAAQGLPVPASLLVGDLVGVFSGLGVPVGAIPLAQEGLVSDINMSGTGRSYAAFMHWNFDFTDTWSATAGIRYSKDEKTGAMKRRFFTANPVDPFRLLGAQPGPEYDNDYDDSAVSGQFALRYQFNDDTMAYLSYSLGYKSGGVNLDNQAAGSVGDNPDEATCAVNGDCTPNDPNYDSEFITGYELGLKTEYFEGRARSNFAAFYNELEDLQVANFDGLAFSILNSPEATVYGLEMENQFVLTNSLTLGMDVTYLPEANFGESEKLTAEALGTPASLSGRRFAQAPELVGNLSLTLDQPLTSELTLRGRIAAYYSGEQFTNPANNEMRDAITELAFTMGVMHESLGMSLNLWCQNCTDERYVTQHFNSPLQNVGNDYDHNAYVSAPRTYGVTLRGNF
ncbi:TonB-dependent receptor [Spongiibacter sp. KMU-158]|uniref:TonB-dependent receptor n=1 Tax=Spongiibacter pelagi TaxID=2760804 RepID=A0A927GVQ5_9GAMM|nr:TonB-dependent receptor [Spongiibacter pelagi]MBD2858916.1 TonB-dependent receptor [Spongiibacter pelagi]